MEFYDGASQLMDQIIELLKGFGAPNWVLLGILLGYFALKELKFLSWFERKGDKSDRELLSLDERAFREQMLADRRELRQALTECDRRHDESEQRHIAEMRSCEARYDELSKRFTDFLNAAQIAGLDLLMKIAPVRGGPLIPPVTP